MTGSSGVGALLTAVQPSIWSASAWAFTTMLGTGGLLVASRRTRAAEREALRASEAASAERAQERRRESEWVQYLHRLVTQGGRELNTLAERIRRGEQPQVPPARPSAGGDGRGFESLEGALVGYQDQVLAVVADAAARQQVEILVHIARRLQSLLLRALSKLDEVQRTVEDPDELALLLELDHLITLLRRSVESLAVLGGAVPRQVKNPLSIKAVLRHGTAEIEKFSRVQITAPAEGAVHGHAVVDVTHLLAELLENATAFSPPKEPVHMRADRHGDGLAIRIEDRGLSMTADHLQAMNRLLARPEDADLTTQLTRGQIGLIVVAHLARRHDITIRLATSDRHTGIQATVTLPARLLAASTTLPAPPALVNVASRTRAYVTAAQSPPTLTPRPGPGPRQGPKPVSVAPAPGAANPGRPPLPVRTRTVPVPPIPDPGTGPAHESREGFDPRAAACFIHQFQRGAALSPPDLESTDD
ncbi:ATP-binding protein [Streptomyces sp. NPDC005953]|uniref:sensor histidine kinase n=1 Tax=Streptomyces sp. NPDC005953 TaxID=3156719 RepID=UPI0033E793B7